MAEVVKINSKKGLVSLTQKDIAENDLASWLRTNSKGFGHYSFINQQPFERVAAKLFVDKYPSTHVKIAESIVCTKEGGVDVFLRITDDQSRGFYNTHPTKLVFNKGKQTVIDDITKHGSEEGIMGVIEDDDLKEDFEDNSSDYEESEDEEFYGEIENFLSEIKNLSEEDLIKKVSPEELEEISKMLDLDNKSEYKYEEDENSEKEDLDDLDFDDIDTDIEEEEEEKEEEDEEEEGNYEYEDEEETGEDEDEKENEDNDNDDIEFEEDYIESKGNGDILKEVNLEDFSEDKGPEIIEIEGKVPEEIGSVEKIPSDKVLRDLIKEILG